MISKNCFTADWLEQKRRQLKTDPYLLERPLHAFALLGHLAESGLDFVFKGGTSLLLYVPVIRRLSIDIDILCSAPAEILEQSVANVASLSPFISYKEEDRGVRGLPNRRHFRFFTHRFSSAIPPHLYFSMLLRNLKHRTKLQESI
jgi:hypothetical protein